MRALVAAVAAGHEAASRAWRFRDCRNEAPNCDGREHPLPSTLSLPARYGPNLGGGLVFFVLRFGQPLRGTESRYQTLPNP